LVLQRAGKVQIHRAHSVLATAVIVDGSELSVGLLHIANPAPKMIRDLRLIHQIFFSNRRDGHCATGFEFLGFAWCMIMSCLGWQSDILRLSCTLLLG